MRLLKVLLACLFFASILFLPHSHGRGLSPHCLRMTLHPLNAPDITLGNFYGKSLVVIFFQSTCLACREEISRLERMRRERGDFSLLGFSMDRDEGRARDFARGLNFPVVMADERVFKCFGEVQQVPKTVVLSPELFVVGSGEDEIGKSPPCHCNF